jgi:hypothetical protein
VAWVRGLELRKVIANYPFEKSRRFAEIQPNFGHGDHSRLSCGATSGSQWLHEIKLEVEGLTGAGYAWPIAMATATVSGRPGSVDGATFRVD